MVEVATPKLKDAADITEEDGAFVCSICLEGYRTQPSKVDQLILFADFGISVVGTENGYRSFPETPS